MAPELCAETRCYPARKTDCSDVASASFDRCTTYAWDMERPWLRQDLSILTLHLPPSIREFTACWYDCGNPDAEVPLYRRHDGEVALLDIADRLFASARVLPLDKVARLDTGGDEVFLVTTPAAYRSWATKDARRQKDPRAAFEKAMGAKPVRYFDAGAGPPIEVYTIRRSRTK
jgi:hypothetical protein